MHTYNKIVVNSLTVLALWLGVYSMNVSAQGLMIYPAAGQSPQQQQQDQYQCHLWSVQQSGYDPNNSPAQSYSQGGDTAHSMLKGGARGAALGAAIGAIAGDAGKGAAIGATAGGLGGGFKARDRQAQASSSSSVGLQNYNRAMKSCLGAKGYTVN